MVYFLVSFTSRSASAKALLLVEVHFMSVKRLDIVGLKFCGDVLIFIKILNVLLHCDKLCF
jgi:hypothetical protein